MGSGKSGGLDHQDDELWYNGGNNWRKMRCAGL